MLSVTLYGKNDSHGYNYHKRLAISLNCIAEMLSLENDEILFVDDGTPFDMPTVIEAIADTLTEKTRSLLKVIRNRNHHSLFPRESLSRNIAIRNSNPKNRWILSTNIDMIFLSVDPDQTLSSIVADLPEGFYQLPRFELPENLWEYRLNRLSPIENLALLRRDATKLQLNTVVRRPGFLSYDNPGDFQLMPRNAIFEINGFNEQMNKKWHVDSNLCKRMHIYYNMQPLSLEGKIHGYHCNHTRQITSAHKQKIPENNWKVYVRDLKSPYLPKQKDHWGLSGKEIEEVKLEQVNHFIDCGITQNYELMLDRDSFNTLTYSSAKILPHLIDHFHYLPPKCSIGYVGYNQKLLSLIKERFSVISFDENSSLKEFYNQTTLIIFDFGFDQEEFNGESVNPSHPLYAKLRPKLKDIMGTFINIVRLEKRGKKRKKLIGINVLFGDFRALFYHHLSMQKTTFFTGISFGYIKKNPYKIKQLKFFLMYLIVRNLYNFTDKIRNYSYKSILLRRVVQHK